MRRVASGAGAAGGRRLVPYAATGRDLLAMHLSPCRQFPARPGGDYVESPDYSDQ
ncbi:hypothetical protein [Microbispora sp. H10670]|uniref:hypothetical protein n=1 Tax=Microbispora sp. H10670 TaxID=2729108 RepID=UPI00160406A7|nr:hypothetical protein [Microbispora sp. H10670]